MGGGGHKHPHHFGHLDHRRGDIKYSISPFEQRAFANFFSRGLPNTFRRIRSQLFIVAPPFVIGYLIYSETEKYHHHLSRKNPADYANDV